MNYHELHGKVDEAMNTEAVTSVLAMFATDSIQHHVTTVLRAALGVDIQAVNTKDECNGVNLDRLAQFSDGLQKSCHALAERSQGLVHHRLERLFEIDINQSMEREEAKLDS